MPIWLHPNRPQFVADLDAYKDKGSMFQIWNTLGKAPVLGNEAA